MTKALVAVLTVCLLSGLMSPLEVTSYTISDIDGSTSLDILFDKAGERTVNLAIPGPFKAISAEVNVSGGPTVPGGTSFPRNVSMDVGNDGKVEWAFDGPGYGPLGRQDRFSDNATSKDLIIDNSTSVTYELLVPKDSQVIRAGMTLTGVPTAIRSSSKTVKNESLHASANRTYLVPDIKDTDIAINSSISLTDVAVVQDKVDVNQSSMSNWYSLTQTAHAAQSFRINKTDPKQQTVDLYSIEVNFQAISIIGIMIDLTVYNTSQASDYQPTGNPIGSTIAGENAIKNGYVNFTFVPPLQLEPDKVYSMIFGDNIMGGNMPALRYHEQVGGNNANSKYPVPGCYMHVTNDGGLSWTSFHERDWAFRTHVGIARPISSSETKNIEIDGKMASAVNGRDVYFNQTPRYNSTGWNFTVVDQLPLGLLYNLSAKLDFDDAPDHVAIDIGADGAAEYSNTGNLTTVVNLPNLKDAVASAVDTAVGLGKNRTDAYGNGLVPVTVKVSANGQGHLKLENLFVLYNFTARMHGLKDAIVAYQAAHGSSGTGTLKVPIKVKSMTAGVVQLSNITILYDGAPRQVKKAPNGLSIPEEGLNASLVDLTALFQDDFDTDLTFTVHNFTTSSKVNGSLNISAGSTSQLFVDARKADNWTGSVTVIVNVTDSNGLTSASDPINFTITNVNDAPVITSASSMYATAGYLYRYNITIVDCDSTSFSIWLEKAPTSMRIDMVNRSILWTPGQADIGLHRFVLKVSDGQLEAGQNITITVRPYGSSGGNRPPLVQGIPDQTTAVDDNMTVQFSAIDPDHDPLWFSLVSGPAGLTVNNTTGLIKWRPDKVGNFTATVRVSDGILWTDVSLNITVKEKGAMRPNVTIERPLSGQKIDGPLTMIGKASGSRIVKIEYSIDSGQWVLADLQSDGTWSAEASITDLKAGIHTLVVRATDSTGQKAQTFTTFEKKGTSTTKPTGLAGMQGLSYMLLLIAIIAAIIAGIGWAKMRSPKGARPAKGPKAKPGTVSKESGPKDEGKSDLNSAFLVYHDGRLITYSSRSEIADLDATLQVIKDFVKASFRGEVGRLDSLRYENMNIILERGVQMYLVVITPEGDEMALQGLRRRMRSFLGDVHDRYKHILKVWDGKFKSVKPVEKMVEDLVHGKWSPQSVRPKDDVKEKDEEVKHEDAPKKEEESKRWDESPDLEDKDLSKVERQKLLQDKLTRGEISEEEFEKLTAKLR
jgi:hypothetical protein